MNGRAIRLLALGVISAIVLPCSHAAGNPQEGNLNGTVWDFAGAVVPGATVRLFTPDRMLETKTASDGNFSFANVPSGTYEFQANYPGYDTRVETFDIGLGTPPRS